jgi:hypothetical protein
VVQRKTPKEERREAVRRINEDNVGVDQIAREFGVVVDVVKAWIKEFAATLDAHESSIVDRVLQELQKGREVRAIATELGMTRGQIYTLLNKGVLPPEEDPPLEQLRENLAEVRRMRAAGVPIWTICSRMKPRAVPPETIRAWQTGSSRSTSNSQQPRPIAEFRLSIPGASELVAVEPKEVRSQRSRCRYRG